MKVFFVGAGPGAKDLITVRGAEILKRVSLVMYAGSLVPPEVLCYCRTDAEIIVPRHGRAPNTSRKLQQSQ